jgi:hypothetical protein
MISPEDWDSLASLFPPALHPPTQTHTAPPSPSAAATPTNDTIEKIYQISTKKNNNHTSYLLAPQRPSRFPPEQSPKTPLSQTHSPETFHTTELFSRFLPSSTRTPAPTCTPTRRRTSNPGPYTNTSVPARLVLTPTTSTPTFHLSRSRSWTRTRAGGTGTGIDTARPPSLDTRRRVHIHIRVRMLRFPLSL